jgi:hypothetical protein
MALSGKSHLDVSGLYWTFWVLVCRSAARTFFEDPVFEDHGLRTPSHESDIRHAGNFCVLLLVHARLVFGLR